VRQYACQIHYPTKLDQLRAKLRAFGQGHIELDLNHSPGLALLTLSNPSKHNALTGKMMAELADCVDFLEDAISGTHPLPQLHTDSKLVLKCAGNPVDSKQLDQGHVEILQGLVGVIVTGAENKSYCAGLGMVIRQSVFHDGVQLCLVSIRRGRVVGRHSHFLLSRLYRSFSCKDDTVDPTGRI
jgi:ethylmalonyl-CoA/methylmalonyl-CoA decarboxylase